jgi:hypothetical protein
MLSPNHGFKIDQPFKDYAIVKIYGDSIIALAIDGKRRVLKNDILLLTKDQSINGTVKYFHNIKVEN